MLHRSYRGIWGADWTAVEIDPSGVSFNPTISDWFTVFLDVGFTVQNCQEIFPPADAKDIRAGIPAGWAGDYPVEQARKLAKPG